LERLTRPSRKTPVALFLGVWRYVYTSDEFHLLLIAMDKLSRMRLSRNDWKDKARDRAEELREARKTEKRLKGRIEELQEEVKLLKVETALQSRATAGKKTPTD
jgi:hypothetical protein